MLFESVAEQMVNDSFLKWIHEQESHLRLENYNEYWNYYYGYHRDSLNPKIKDSLDYELAVVCNFCQPVINIAVDHVGGSALTLDCSEMGQKTVTALRAESILNFVYEENGLFDDAFIEFLRNMMMKGDVFTHVYLDEAVGIGINVLRPDIVFPKYLSSNFKYMEACAIKSYEVMPDGTHHWLAHTYRPDKIQIYDLGEKPVSSVTEEAFPRKDSSGKPIGRAVTQEPDKWELVDEVPNELQTIPIFHTKNNIDSMPFGVGDLQVMLDLQDFLNKTFTDLSEVMDDQAFQRMFIFGGKEGEPYYISPGMITEIANESGSLQVIPPTNIAQFLYSIDTTIDNISAVTMTPRQAFQGYSDVPTSGYALSIRMHQLELKCKEKKANIRKSFRQMNRLILRIAEALGWAEEGEFQNVSTKIKFPGGLPKDQLMTAQIHAMEQSMGVRSRVSIMEERGVENIAEEIARINAETPEASEEEGAAAD